MKPQPGQESVWDYPRPPRLERTGKRLTVHHGDVLIADTVLGWRVLETSHPPTYYLPPADVVIARLTLAKTPQTTCEWKGRATYWDVAGEGRLLGAAAWSYEQPTGGFAPIAGHLAFPADSFRCTVDGEEVVPQQGGFYGGWITADVVGPFKGEPGSWGW